MQSSPEQEKKASENSSKGNEEEWNKKSLIHLFPAHEFLIQD